MKNLVKNLFKSRKQQCNILAVSKQREQLIAFLNWKHNTILEAGLSFEELVDIYLKAINCC